MRYFHKEKTPDENIVPVITSQFIDSCRYYFKECLNEKQRRLFTGLLHLMKLTYSEIHEFCGFSEKTIRKELCELLERNPLNSIKFNIRITGVGRKSVSVKKEK